jgi:hypothetical protein
MIFSTNPKINKLNQYTRRDNINCNGWINEEKDSTSTTDTLDSYAASLCMLKNPNGEITMDLNVVDCDEEQLDTKITPKRPPTPPANPQEFCPFKIKKEKKANSLLHWMFKKDTTVYPINDTPANMATVLRKKLN